MTAKIYEVPLAGEQYDGKRVVVAHTLSPREQAELLPVVDRVSNHLPPRNGYARFNPAGFALRAVSAEVGPEEIKDAIADLQVDVEVVVVQQAVEPSELSRYVGEAVIPAAFDAMPKPVANRPDGIEVY